MPAADSRDWPVDAQPANTEPRELPSAPDYLYPLEAKEHLSSPLATAGAVLDQELRAAFDLFADPTTCAIGREDEVELVLEHLGIHCADDVLAGAISAAAVPPGCGFGIDDVRTIIEYVRL